MMNNTENDTIFNLNKKIKLLYMSSKLDYNKITLLKEIIKELEEQNKNLKEIIDIINK
jgi:bacterioferritin (cytochrome b1)